MILDNQFLNRFNDKENIIINLIKKIQCKLNLIQLFNLNLVRIKLISLLKTCFIKIILIIKLKF